MAKNYIEYRGERYHERAHPDAYELALAGMKDVPPGEVLDVAAGAGYTSARLADLGHRVRAIDIHPEQFVPRDIPFVRGDANSDGAVNIADSVFVLAFLFSGGTAPRCEDAADFDDDGTLTITDPVYLLGYLFSGGPVPPRPFPQCGATELEIDAELGCEASCE